MEPQQIQRQSEVTDYGYVYSDGCKASTLRNLLGDRIERYTRVWIRNIIAKLSKLRSSVGKFRPKRGHASLVRVLLINTALAQPEQKSQNT